MKKLINEFKEFAMGGNLIDLAIGIIVGSAFSTVINSLVSDIFVPILGILFGNQDGLKGMEYNGIMYGNFLSSIISFLLTSLCLFIVVKAINIAKNRLIKKEEEIVKEDIPTDNEQIIALLKQISKKMNKSSK